MATTNENSSLTEAQRTVVFSPYHAKRIHDLFTEFSPDGATEALEEIAQFIINHSSEGANHVGSDFFILRQLRDFYKDIEDALRPIYQQYNP